jgi:hypothetical protein
MEHAKFQELLERRIALTLKVLGRKADEYSFRGDRLSNFKDAAAFQNTTPEEALLGMWTKHLVSIKDIIKHPEIERTKEVIDEKITDAINYLILLEAILKEKDAT